MGYDIANEIRIGSVDNPTYHWSNPKIVLNSLKGVFSVDVIGNELSIDTFTAIVRTNVDAPLVYSPLKTGGAAPPVPGYYDGYKTLEYPSGKRLVYVTKTPDNYSQTYMLDMPFGMPVFWVVDDALFFRGYLRSVQRVSRYHYKLDCVSGVGLLDTMMHYGGMYSGADAETVLADIIGDTFEYSVAASVRTVRIYGRLPVDTARNNLHRLLFVMGAALTKDANCNYRIAFLSNTLYNVPKNRVALGGKVDYTTPADLVEITEHTFYQLASDEETQLFDNTGGSAVSGLAVIFSDPVYNLTASGNLTISASNCNYAIVSGTGTLTGKKYTHNKIIVRDGSGGLNVRRVTDNELVSWANSHFVANRVFAYYSSSKKLEAKIKLENEKLGQLLAIMDAYGDITNAFLSSMELSITSTKLALCKLISGYVPFSNGNNFTHHVVVKADRVWTSPISGLVRFVLIGGAQGGQGGYDGSHGGDKTHDPMLTLYTGDGSYGYGTDVAWYYADANQPAASGGAAGAAGAKAAFLISDQTVTAGLAISITVGAGGAGGARNGGAGSAGTPSTAVCTAFELSSADGVSTFEGYNDPVSGLTYAIDGVDGVAGGNGGTVAPYGFTQFSDTPDDGGSGANVSTYSGGSGGDGYTHKDTNYQGWVTEEWKASGGAGGGAAFGKNGGAGTSASRTGTHDYDLISGSGGAGADAVAPKQTGTYGQGGTGGNGGGGGGNAGGAYHFQSNPYGPGTSFSIGSGGVGGKGSVGGKGGDGLVIIYY